MMTRELLASGGVFGVLLIREGDEVGGGAVPFTVGTVARIESCREVEGGRLMLGARGLRRFRLERMLDPRPYPFGEITYLDDARWETDERLQRALETVRATFPVYFRLALSLTDQWARTMRLPAGPHGLVNVIAPWLQADEQIKQRLLAIEPAAERLAYLAEVLDDLLNTTREEVAEYRRRKFSGLGAGN